MSAPTFEFTTASPAQAPLAPSPTESIAPMHVAPQDQAQLPQGTGPIEQGHSAMNLGAKGFLMKKMAASGCVALLRLLLLLVALVPPRPSPSSPRSLTAPRAVTDSSPARLPTPSHSAPLPSPSRRLAIVLGPPPPRRHSTNRLSPRPSTAFCPPRPRPPPSPTTTSFTPRLRPRPSNLAVSSRPPRPSSPPTARSHPRQPVVVPVADRPHGLALHQEARPEQAATLCQVRRRLPLRLERRIREAALEGPPVDLREGAALTHTSSPRSQGQAALALVVVPGGRPGTAKEVEPRPVVDDRRQRELGAVLSAPCLASAPSPVTTSSACTTRAGEGASGRDGSAAHPPRLCLARPPSPPSLLPTVVTISVFAFPPLVIRTPPYLRSPPPPLLPLRLAPLVLSLLLRLGSSSSHPPSLLLFYPLDASTSSYCSVPTEPFLSWCARELSIRG